MAVDFLSVAVSFIVAFAMFLAVTTVIDIIDEHIKDKEVNEDEQEKADQVP